MTSWACLVKSGLNNIFHLKTHSDFFLRSSFNKFANFDKSYTVENNKVSSASNLAGDSKFLGRSLMYIKKSNDCNIGPWGTAATTGAHLEYWSLKNNSLLSIT